MRTDHVRAAASRLALVAVACTLLGSALQAPAAAEVVSGSCTGTATLGDSVVLDAEQPRDTAVQVPAEASFAFVGSIDREAGEEVAVPYSGELRLLLPVGSWPVEEWSGETTETEVVVTGGYALPGVLPPGTGPIPLEVVHIVDGEVCRIVVSIATGGSTWDPVTIGLLVVTLLLVAATFAAGRRDARGRGRPLVGLVAGLLGGLAAAATLFGAAAIALDSAVWWVLPAVLAALGLLLGAAAPFGVGAGPDATTTDDRGPGGGSATDASPPGSSPGSPTG